MSIRVMARLWDHGPEKQTHLLVLLALADFANDDGQCWPAIRSIAKKARLTDRGAQKIIRQLEAIGWLEISAGGGRGHCNKYQIHTTPQSTETPNDIPSLENEETPNEKHRIDDKPRTAVQETLNSGSPEPSRTVNNTLEANASKDACASFAAVDFTKEVFDRGVAFLGKYGIPERQARALVGKWRKDAGDQETFNALRDANREGVTDPAAWIAARLKPRPNLVAEVMAERKRRYDESRHP